jgi:demethylmenaquinone methyltransferase/2-methoxy-6-polyprenyl-1,4-benzoquinol methylase
MDAIAPVPFGFEDIPETEKDARVRAVFDDVATRYDLMNDLMSGGVHRLWKDIMIDWLNPQPNQILVDVAGGTGDIARRVAARRRGTGSRAPVVVCDINEQMLSVGQRGAGDEKSPSAGIGWVAGSAEALPFPDGSVDLVTIAFGIRNVTHIDKALQESQRILRPGGRFLCLEFSRVTVPGADVLYDAFSFHGIPAIARMVTGDDAPYRYLVESIRRFPDQKRFAAMMRAAGLQRVTYRNLAGGIAALHSGWRL